MNDILVVDDEPDICTLLKSIFEEDGCFVRLAINSSEALDLIAEKEPDLVVLDIWLRNSDLDGIEILKKITNSSNNIPVVIISGHGNIEIAVEAVKLGAYDFIEKPFNTEQIRVVKNRAIESRKLKIAINDLKNQNKKDYSLIGNSQPIKNLKKQLDQLADRNSRILITGETGSGKETAVGYIHSRSKVHTGELIVVLCSSITDDNYEELFCGKEDGGEIYPGIFDQSRTGFLYLKEITDLPRNAQNKLLNVLSTNFYTRVGGKAQISFQTRIISGSCFSSKTIIERNMIRLDLLDRLNVIEIMVPPLSFRSDDISSLSSYFVEQFHHSQKLPMRKFSDTAIKEFRSMKFIGNVKQLRNLVERILILGTKSGSITRDEVVQHNKELSDQTNSLDVEVEDLLSLNLKEARSAFERYYINQQVLNFNGNITKTAKFIGMERSALHRKIKDLKAFIKNSK